MQTQYLTYRTLLAPVAGQGISEAEAKDILWQVLPHLSQLHDRGQSHGSISLDTVAYDYSRMEIILLDANEKNHPIYLAPEILQTQQPTPTADIYALGIVIIVLLTGFPPEALKEEENTWNWQEIGNVSDQFIQILDIALLADPNSRYVNATAMLRSLQPVIKHSESTLTIAPSDHLEYLLPTTSTRNSTSKSSLPLVSASSQAYSSRLSNLTSAYSHRLKKLKRFKINLSNFPIYKNVKNFNNQSNNQFTISAKDVISILIAVFLGFGITLSSAVGTYFYILSKSTSIANTNKKNLEVANAEEQSMDKAITNIYEIKKADQPDQLLSQWKANINQQVVKETKDETLQSVINTFKNLTPNPYGQVQGKAITEGRQNLNSSVVTTSMPPVAPPLPNVEPLNNPIIETYIPPTETYIPPTETYIPSTESSSPPLPPAPRVAN